MTGLLRSELRKIFSTRLWWGLLIGVVAASLTFSALIAAVSGRGTVNGAAQLSLNDPATVRSVYTAGLSVCYLFTLAFGIIAMSGEFRHQTFTATILATPRRLRVVMAKIGSVGIVSLGYGVVAVLAGVVGGAPVILLRHGSLFLGSGDTARALALAVLAIALWGVLGLGVGTLIRNQVVALLVTIGVAWIAEPLLALGLDAAHLGAVAQYLPSQATSAVISPATTNSGVDVALLPWWGGALVVIGYAVLSGGLGALFTLRRDVT